MENAKFELFIKRQFAEAGEVSCFSYRDKLDMRAAPRTPDFPVLCLRYYYFTLTFDYDFDEPLLSQSQTVSSRRFISLDQLLRYNARASSHSN